MERDIILNHIQKAQENSCVDYKKEFYTSLKNSDLPKDVSSFANCMSGEDKYIIFGVEDETREIVGIEIDKLPSQDDVDAYIEKIIEPFIETVCGVVQFDNKYVGYIKILAKNTNPPYVIKGTCGKNNSINKGDIYIRKGACNMKASRADIDAMYTKNGKIHVKMYEDIAIIEPIHIEGDLIKNPTFGRIDIEIFNETTRPILIAGGEIKIRTGELGVSRPIWSTKPVKNMHDSPLKLQAMHRDIHTMLFDFYSADCVCFGFDTSGHMDKLVTLQVELYDTDGNRYLSDEIEACIIARGDVLHKVKLKDYQENKDNLSIVEKILFRIKR